MATPLRETLHHLPLPGLTKYAAAAIIQDRLVQQLFTHKSPTSQPMTDPPSPTVLTAEFHPVYTTGRRDIHTLSPSQISRLNSGGADFHEALRGGQTTYHGPGQLVAYPIVDLKAHGGASPFAAGSRGLTAREYIHLLEEAVIKTCASYGIVGYRTENPGVWTSKEDKVCAVGVHMRRNVTSHGIGLNIRRRVLEGFERIVACGLEGKRTTCLEDFGVGTSVHEVGNVFVQKFAECLSGVGRIRTV